MEQGKLSHINIRSAKIVWPHWKSVWKFPIKLKSTTLWSRNSTTMYLPKRNQHMRTMRLEQEYSYPIFSVVTVVVSSCSHPLSLGAYKWSTQNYKRRTAPNIIHSSPKLEMTPTSFNKWVDKQLSSNNTTECYSAKKRNKLLTRATTPMSLKDILPLKGQIRKNTSCTIQFIWSSGTGKIDFCWKKSEQCFPEGQGEEELERAGGTSLGWWKGSVSWQRCGLRGHMHLRKLIKLYS